MEDRLNEMGKYFGVYGRGNFDLHTKDIILIFKALKAEDYKQQLKQLYEKLHKERMG
jgi:hypothetical protein